MWERKGEKGIIRASSHNCLYRWLVLLRHLLPKRTAPLGLAGRMKPLREVPAVLGLGEQSSLRYQMPNTGSTRTIRSRCCPGQMGTCFVGPSALSWAGWAGIQHLQPTTLHLKAAAGLKPTHWFPAFKTYKKSSHLIIYY